MYTIFKKIPPHFYVSISGWVSRVLIALIQLVSIPIFYKRLGMDEYAVFTVVTSLTAWYALVDFGVGIALQNFISKYRANNKPTGVLINNMMPILFILFLLLAITIIVFGGFLKSWLFSNIPNSLSNLNFKIVLTLFCWYYLLLISTKIFFAYQKGFFGYFYQTIAYLTLLILILIIYFFKIKLSLAIALYIWVIPLFASGVLGMIHVILISDVKISLNYSNKYFYYQLIRRASQFWWFSLSANGVLAIDYLIIVKLLSAKTVVTYNIINKIFLMVLFGYSTVLSAIWPILSEWYAKNNEYYTKLAERKIRQTIIVGILYMLLATLAVILFRHIIVGLFRVQQAINFPISLLIFFGVYVCIRVCTDTYTTALQASNRMKVFLLQTPIQAVISIIAMLLLARFDLIGIMIALILSYILVPCWVVPWYHYKNYKCRDYNNVAT